MAAVSRPLSTTRVELAAEPAHGEVTWVSSYDVDPFDVPDQDKVTVLADWSAELLAHDQVDHVEAVLHAVMENKFYADLAGTVTHAAAGPAAPGAGGRRHRQGVRPVRHHAHARAAGRAGLGVPHRHRLGLGRRAGRAARPAAARSCAPRRWRPATTTSSCTRRTCGSPSTSRSGTPPSWTGRWATRPTTPARRSRPSTSSASCTYGSPGHARHRRPHRRARPVHDRLRRRGRRGADVGPRARRDAGRLPARPRHGPPQGTRALQRLRASPTPPPTSRCSGWRTSRCSRRRTARPPTS